MGFAPRLLEPAKLGINTGPVCLLMLNVYNPQPTLRRDFSRNVAKPTLAKQHLWPSSPQNQPILMQAAACSCLDLAVGPAHQQKRTLKAAMNLPYAA